MSLVNYFTDSGSSPPDGRWLLRSHSALEPSKWPPQTPPAPKFQFCTPTQVLALPKPKWLVRRLLTEGSFGVLYGASETGKSFVALDLALSIATGRGEWAGLKIKQGTVLYIVGEGSGGLRNRLEAWMQSHPKQKSNEIRFLLRPIQMLGEDGGVPEYKRLADELAAQEIRPDLIVIDTLARCFLGGEENSAKDMGQFIAAVQHLQQVSGAAVLVVHHTGKPSMDGQSRGERGSSALRGAADTMLKVGPEGEHVVKVTCDKQKDAARLQKLRFRKSEVYLGEDDGEQVTSLVFHHVSGYKEQVASPDDAQLALLSALAAAPNHTMKSGDWSKAAN